MPPRKRGLQGYVRRRRKKTTKVVPPVEQTTRNSENEAEYPKADDADDSPAHIGTTNTETNRISPARIHVVISSSSISDNQTTSTLSPPLKMKFSTLSSVKIVSPAALEKPDEPATKSVSHVETCPKADDEDELADVVAEAGKRRRPKATSTKRKKKSAEVTTWAVSQCDEGPEQNTSLRVRLRQRVKTVADSSAVPVVQTELAPSITSGSLSVLQGAVCANISESDHEAVQCTADSAASSENSKDSCCNYDDIDEPRQTQNDVILLENHDKQVVGGEMLLDFSESKQMVSQPETNTQIDSSGCDGRIDSLGKIGEVHVNIVGLDDTVADVQSVVSDSTKTGASSQHIEMDTVNSSQESIGRSTMVRRTRRGKKNVKSSLAASIEPRVTRSRRCGNKTVAVSDSKMVEIAAPDVSKTDASVNLSEAAICRLNATDNLVTADSSNYITANVASAGLLPLFNSSSSPTVVKSNDKNADHSEASSAVSTTSSIGHVASSTSNIESSCHVVVSVPDIVVQSSVKNSMLDTAADCSVASTPDVITSSVSSKILPSHSNNSSRAARDVVLVDTQCVQSNNCDELKPDGTSTTSHDNPSMSLPARVEDSTVTEHHDVETTVDEVPLKKRRIRRFDMSEVPDGSDGIINSIDVPCVKSCDVELCVGVKNTANIPNTPRHMEPRGNMYVGAHTSVTGNLVAAVQAASRLGSRAFSVFIKSQSQLLPPALDFAQALAFKQALKTHGYLPHLVVPHASYLLNCGADDPFVLSQSRKSLVDDLERCRTLGLSLFNFHPGSFKSSSTSVDECVRRIAESINYAHSRVDGVTTVLENMCGQRNTVGGRFIELRQIIDQVKDQLRVGICLDTCHAFAAGYDLRCEEGFKRMMEDFEQTVGLNFLKVIHLNDSKDDVGSHTDHHVNIGKGRIGLNCFRWIMNDARFQRLPIILETPLGSHKSEIELLYSLVQ